jgi:hypothetical protein
MKKYWKFWLPCFLSFTQCRNEEAIKTQMIQNLLDERKTSFFENKQRECYKQFTREVEGLADSLLMLRTKNTKYDSLTIPYDTLRPIKPEIAFPDYKKPERETEGKQEK